MGKIWNTYLKFGITSDQYLGRTLSFLDPDDPSFALLPAHWREPFHEDVTRGLAVSFGNIIPRYENTEHDPTGTLSLLPASMVYNIEWIRGIIAKYPGHPFAGLPLLSEET